MNRIFIILLIASSLIGCRPGESRITESQATGNTHLVEDVVSNNKVSSFAEDAQGHIWIGTDRGLNRYNIYEFHQYFSGSSDRTLSNNRIQSLYRDRHNNLWVATIDGINRYTDQDDFERIPIKEYSQNAIQFFENNDGVLFLNMNVHLCRFDRENNEFVSVIHDFDPYRQFSAKCYVDKGNRIWVVNPSLLRSYNSTTMEPIDSIRLENYYTASTLDDNGRLWLAANDGIKVFDVNRHGFIQTPNALLNDDRLKNKTIDHLHPIDNKIIGVTGKSMFVFDKSKNSVIFDDEITFPFKAPKFNVSTIYTDQEGNIWFGSEDQGYSVAYRHQDKFANALSTFFKNISVVSIAKAEGTIVLLTLDNDIYTCDMSLSDLPVLSTKLPGNIKITAVKNDNENNIWLLALNKVFKAGVVDGSLSITSEYDVPLPINLTQDRTGTIWVGTYTENIYALRKGDDKFQSIQIRPKTFTFTRGVQLLPDGRVMLATFDYPFQFINPDNWLVEQSNLSSDNVAIQALSSKFVPTSTFADSRGNIWIGTVGNGLLQYHLDKDSLSRIDDMSCTDICDVLEDNYSNLWISTKYGLNKYDYTTGKISHFYLSDGIGGNQFYSGSNLKLDDGTLLFGGTHGLTVFKPTDLTSSSNVRLYFENLRIHNKLVIPDDNAPIDRILSLNPDITLNSDQNSFSISFIALEYGEYERYHYLYKMEGVDPHWIDAGNNREVSYSNLAPGKYKFKVKITNPDKNQDEAENSLDIIIKPSPLLSWWAKSLYLVLLSIIGYCVCRIYSRIRKVREEAQFAEQEKLQEKKVNEMNMSFFANISHEFRTPLTLIAGPVAELSDNSTLSEKDRKLMGVVRRNVYRMQRLVNQILDFHKLENDTLRLQVEQSDVIEIVKNIVDTFAFNARQKKISLVTYGLEDSFMSLVDADKIEKIIYNLISNAIKYTPSGGQINVSFDIISNDDATTAVPELAKLNDAVPSDYIKVSVMDNGPGFPEKQLPKVFDRYYQCEGDGRYNWGTGIGLYYAKKLSIIHHGYLIADNRENSHGAVLTLFIPINETLFLDNERVDIIDKDKRLIVVDAENDNQEEHIEAGNGKKNILVVDDDIEIAHYIKSLLEVEYNVICRHDAASALEILPKFNPDLVISDVVMPGGSGFGLCKDIKENVQYCHIPVVLLTAKHTVTEQVEGLDSGADAYVTKPFEPSYLLAMVHTTIENRTRLKEMLTAATEVSSDSKNDLSPHDKKFMDEFYSIMESELNNSELDLVKALDVLKISRTKLYYKLKGLTGQTPASFFKIYKLNRAAGLLREGKYNISEIADMTGFSSLSHFSTSFKKQFGVTPSDFI